MSTYFLFIDASADPKSNIGFGAYLLLQNLDEIIPKKEIKCIRIEDTSSSKLELQLVIYVLNKVAGKDIKLKVFSDSNAILSLLKRKEKLIEMGFRSKKDRHLNLHHLYKEFFKLYDPLNMEFIKVKGHIKTSNKSDFDRYFSMVDKASRKALRNFLNKKAT